MSDVFNGDTIVGGAGGDTFLLQENLFAGTSINGSGGSDVIDPQGAITVNAGVVITSVERLALDTSLFTITAALLAGFDQIEADTLTNTGNLALSSGGTLIDLDVIGLTTLNVTGSTANDTLFLRSTSVDINVTGGNGADSITTEDGDDTIDGGAGNDTLDAGVGADSILGGSNDDTLYVRSGDVLVDGGSGSDNFILAETTINESAVGTVLRGGTGTLDVLRGLYAGGLLNALTYTLDAAVGLETIEHLALGQAAVLLDASQLETFTTIVKDGIGTAGIVRLRNGGTATTDIQGLTSLLVDAVAFNDVFNLTFTTSGVTKTDITVEGGLFNDTLTTGDGDDLLLGFDGNDVLLGNAGIDTLDGGIGNDVLTLSSQDDALGGAGNDTIFATDLGFPGSSIDGGADLDSFDAIGDIDVSTSTIFNSVEVLILDATVLRLSAGLLDPFTTISGTGTGLLTLFAGGSATTDVIGLTTLTVIGSAQSDILVFTSPSTDIFVDAGGGADQITTGNGDDTILGGASADILDGGAGSDRLEGGDNNDILNVRNDDTVLGGLGLDTFWVQENLVAAATLDGGSLDASEDQLDVLGAFTINAAILITGIERLLLDDERVTMTATQLNGFTTIDEAQPADTVGRLALSAGGAATTAVEGLDSLEVTGSGVADQLSFLTATTVLKINAGGGADIILTGDANDVLQGFGGVDVLDGGGGADRVEGGGVADILDGGAGNDTVLGGAGADQLDGGAGDDRLTGGIGADIFQFGAFGGSDIVTDFTDGVDLLSFAGFGLTDVDIVALAVASGANTVISLPDPIGVTATVVTLRGFALADLDVADIL